MDYEIKYLKPEVTVQSPLEQYYPIESISVSPCYISVDIIIATDTQTAGLLFGFEKQVTNI